MAPGLLLLAALLTPPAHSQSVEPGLWRADTSFAIIGIPLPPSQDEECISASEAKDIKTTLTKELLKAGCTPTKWLAKDQQLEVSLKCTKSGLDATGNLRGTITAKSYDLTGEAEGTYLNIPSQATIVLKGRWLKSCVK
jgi:hypothetical protein